MQGTYTNIFGEQFEVTELEENESLEQLKEQKFDSENKYYEDGFEFYSDDNDFVFVKNQLLDWCGVDFLDSDNIDLMLDEPRLRKMIVHSTVLDKWFLIQYI